VPTCCTCAHPEQTCMQKFGNVLTEWLRPPGAGRAAGLYGLNPGLPSRTLLCNRRGRRPTGTRPPQHVTSTHMRCRRQAHSGAVGPEQDTCVRRNTGRWGWCMKASSSLTQMHASSSSNPDAESERPPFLRERIAARPARETPRPPAELLRTLPASSVPFWRTRFGPLSVRRNLCVSTQLSCRRWRNLNEICKSAINAQTEGRSKKHLFVRIHKSTRFVGKVRSVNKIHHQSDPHNDEGVRRGGGPHRA
jgi:hypothetical protein